MIKNNRNNEQIYGRNDMIMLDPNNKIYGSLGLADRYVMKTEEGTKLTLSNPKLGSFDDVLTEFNIYGMSKQESTTGANLIDIDNMLNECLVKNADDTYSILKTETNRFSKSFPINLKAGTVVRFDADVIEYNGTYNNKLQCNFGSDTIREGHTITLREDITKVTIYQDGDNDVGTYTKFKNAILSVGKAKVPYEPYTGGKPSPSPDYPQEIKSVVNPTVKVTNEDGVESQTVTLQYTLNAIPVSSGSNVTINGQQYIADYVDVERGKLVKKLKSFTISDIKVIYTWGINENADNITGFYFYTSENGLPKTNNDVMTSTILRYVDNTWGGKNVGCAMSSDSSNNYAILSVPTNMLEDISSDENACASLVKICENTNAIFFYSMTSPIETDLTPEEIEQYKKLSVKTPTTIIENNYDAWMKATYKSTESV